MESQKPKVAMYVKRSFGDKLNASFDFIKENWKILLKFTTYLLLPVSLIQALSLNGLMGGAFAMTAMSKTATVPDTASLLGFMSYYGLYMIVFMIGSILLTSMIYALIRTYNEREERLEGITLGILKPLLFRNIKRLLVMTLFSILVMLLVGLVVGLLAFLSLFTLFLTIPLLIAFVVPLALWAPIYLFEDITVMESFKKTFRLGFATWGGVFLISLIMGFIANVLQGVTMMPWYIATLVKYFFSLSDVGSETTVSAGYSFILYLLGIVQAFNAGTNQVVLPVLALSMSPMAYITRLTKTSMLDALSQDYIRTARAKGVPQMKVIFIHGLRNALIPVITYVGPMIAGILTGSMVVESIFNIGGLGSKFVSAITNRDYTLIMATTIFLACLMVVANLITDIVYKIVDPRIKLD